MRLPRRRFTMRRLMGVVAFCAMIFALFAAQRVPPLDGFVYGTITGLAIVAIAAGAKDSRDFSSALFAVAVGIAFAAPLMSDACNRSGLVVGPALGLIARGVTRRRARKDPAISKEDELRALHP